MNSPDLSSSSIVHQDITKRAREIWERDGCPSGRDLAHWLQAEQELQDESSRSKATATAADQGVPPSTARRQNTASSAPDRIAKTGLSGKSRVA